MPDEGGLTAGIRAETARYLRSQPWLAVDALAPAVAAVEASTLAALTAIVATAVVDPPTPAAPPAARPIRRLALQPSATIVGNMAVRKQPTEQGLELSWDAAPQVIEWVLRVSVRPDPRQDYVEGDGRDAAGRHALLRGRARRASAADPAIRPRPGRQDRAPRGHLGAHER